MEEGEKGPHVCKSCHGYKHVCEKCSGVLTHVTLKRGKHPDCDSWALVKETIIFCPKCQPTVKLDEANDQSEETKSKLIYYEKYWFHENMCYQTKDDHLLYRTNPCKECE